MIGALQLAAAAMLVSEMPRYGEETFVNDRRVIRRNDENTLPVGESRRQAWERMEAEEKAAREERARLVVRRREQGEAAKVAAEEKRRRKNARRLAGRIREIACEMESIKPVEIPQDLRDRYGMRIVNGEVVVPALVGRMLVEEGNA